MKMEGREYPRQRQRKDWDRFQLLECLHYFISWGGVTLPTGDPDLLSGGEDGVGWLPDWWWRMWNVCPGSSGWRKREGRRGGGEEDQERRVEGHTTLAEREGYHDHEIQPESEAHDLHSQGVAVPAAT